MVEFIIGFTVGGFLAWRVCSAFMLSAFTSLMRRLGIKDRQLRELHPQLFEDPDTVEQQPQDPRIQIRLEQHSDTIYAFRADTEQFLAQAPNQEELFDRISKRFPKENFVIRGVDAELLQKSHT
jgi:hypothetical protein